MDEIIARAINAINKNLQSSSFEKILIDARTSFERLLEPNFFENEWTQLYCRHINRLMDYNERISDELLFEWYNDVRCIINGRDIGQLKNNSWERFHDKIKFESQLEQFDLQFQMNFGKRKSLNDIINENSNFFQNYLEKCRSLHSTIQVQGLICNIDDFYEIYGIEKDILINFEKLKSIEINLDCSNKLLQPYEIDSSQNNTSRPFLPSIKQIETNRSGQSVCIESVLEQNRWIIILGDPGSSKTSLLRWITSHYAQQSSNRIPILIRIGEFASWFNQNSTKTLIDYIGEHTWFSEPYCSTDNDKHILKELIDHGHTLILLDGLDEIPNISQRENIVNLVQTFIKDYIRSSDFISAFDTLRYKHDRFICGTRVIETTIPSKSIGNQIIITSRFVGYQSCPIVGPFIKHYSLLSMELKESKDFVEKWMRSVENNVTEILKTETIQLNDERIQILSKQRLNNIEEMFKNTSKLILSNPSLLSLICTFIFQSSNQLNLQSRIELYDYTIKISFSLRKDDQSEYFLKIFLMNVATYLHMNSPSGFIDEFDLKQLCYSTLKQYGLSNEYVNKLLNSLESNTGFIVERGLQVYGFQHLTLQEYFVSQALVNGSSIEHIAKRILSFTIDIRFYEPLILAISWISYYWTYDNYNQFCQILIQPTKDYSIPFGTLLFFESFNHMKVLPSKSTIINALSNLLDCPFEIIGSTYLFWYISNLSNDIIIEWMNSYLIDEQSISKFCRCLFDKRSRKSQTLPTVIYQKLWSFHNQSQSIEFVIEQAIRRSVVRDNIIDQIFNQDLSFDFISTIHPLILSVIISVSGGLYYQRNNDILEISFCTKQMHRESLIFKPIIEYLANHSNKIEILIEHYENVLKNSSLSDTSTVIVDTFIALICLQGLSQPSIYEKYKEYQALPLALNRFKRNWFYFLAFGEYIGSESCLALNTSWIQSELKTILDLFYSQCNEQYVPFLLACGVSLWKLNIFDIGPLFKSINSDNNRINQNFSFMPKLFVQENQLNNIDWELLKLITCLPEYLRKFYGFINVSSKNRTDSLPLNVVLVEHLNQMKRISNDYEFLSKIKPLLFKYSLENYALAIFRERHSDIHRFIEQPDLCDSFFIEESFNWQTLIDKECQRINQAQNQENDLQLSTAIVSLAQIIQSQYNSSEFITQFSCIEIDEIYFAIMNIHNPILRIFTFSFILNLKDPFIFNEEQRDQLTDEMIGLLYSSSQDLPLSTLTYLFIQCYTLRQDYLFVFEDISNIIGQKLNQTSEDDEREGVFIVLRKLNDSNLRPYLFEFAKQTKNLSDLLRFNSIIFYRYFINTNTFDKCNTTLLSMMYLIELGFDVQNLEMYFKNEFEQPLDQSFLCRKIMTFKTATWITDHLHMLNEYLLEKINLCTSIEKKSIPTIEQWLQYKTNKDLEGLVHYAAIELIINGSNIPELTDIINEIFKIDDSSRRISFVRRILSSSLVKLNFVQQILILLKQKYSYAPKISAWINHKDLLECILNFQLEQLNSNISSYQSYLHMIDGCSINIQIYLLKYLQTFIQVELEIKNPIKEEYIAIIVQWIIRCLLNYKTKQNLFLDLYKYVFSLLHDQRYPRIQKSIITAIDNVCQRTTRIKDILMQDDIFINLEKVLHLWFKYPIDIVTVCLLPYGNCVYGVQIYRPDFNVSEKLKKTLNGICQLYFPKILSIRAGICLSFIKEKNQRFSSLNLFKNKWHLTPEITYQILSQLTLYGVREDCYMSDNISEHFNHYPELMNGFLDDLYNYLSNRNNDEYIRDLSPDYIQIAVSISKKYPKIFFEGVRKRSLGENELKTKLLNYFKNHSYGIIYSMKLYTLFGVVTVELLDILQSLGPFRLFGFDDLLDNLKQAFDRNTIEKLFYFLNQKKSVTVFSEYLHILKSLIQSNNISLLEVNQRIPFTDKTPVKSTCEQLNHDEVFNLLLDSSCFKNEKNSRATQKRFMTVNYINEVFDEITERLGEKISSVLAEGAASVRIIYSS